MFTLFKYIFAAVLCGFTFTANAHNIVNIVKQAKESVVGIGVFDPIKAPQSSLHGTGFVVGNGQYIITNHHVISQPLDENSKQRRVVFTGTGRYPQTFDAHIVKIDEMHDLALLRISKKLKPFKLANSNLIPDGTEVAFTGYPIGAVLGLYPATHRGIISAATPVIIPTSHSSQLDVQTLKRLRDPYMVYQMDATAYPGNSGSAVYEVETGQVVAVINKVFVKKTKEAVLADPSGITYSIPVKYVRQLLVSANIDID
ncbi:S1 family peptidase [Aliiglaciecola lipolytica]|uniref:Peptidase S1/S6, chymotrypsin/Hap n=1 Tax=Aliiglaciecola lipolytica E3 TaxID=1127673 RepID=K6Y895_9ALTE|nr:serine protease [Aliiglaciecola lipolytica]GAC12853.1 peptidase S1/S6, chymotrypsin/Hap [Aliiglaciecola lipolytica E3]